MSAKPVIAVIAAGAMGGGVGRTLTEAGCTVLTNLDGRSEATRKRAQEARITDTSLEEIVQRSHFVLSILPPSEAFSLAQKIIEVSKATKKRENDGPIVYVDCNAENKETVKKIYELFEGLEEFEFVDGCIIGSPPKGDYNPTFYASANEKDVNALERFVKLQEYGLKVVPLSEPGAGVGDASALKMSHAGINKGLIGLFAAMILASHASSPTTARALLRELKASQPALLQRLVQAVPGMIPKAYRWVGEMEEIAGFVGGPEGQVYAGLAKLYERIAVENSSEQEILEWFVKEGKKEL
ncbi:hypothetical protein AX16_010594 [Volvariella volvacea WC 439]|nr:hypothetical protein AX16_010594 [Volvariella volvacea WC 439]